MLAVVMFGGRDWIVPAMTLGVIAGIIVIVRYAGANLDGRTRWQAATLKGIALGLLILCLLEPLWSGQRARPGANLFAILADNSESMNVHDPQLKESRGQELKNLLNQEDTPWQVRLSQDFDVRRYEFDSRLQGVPDFAKLDFDGNRTNLRSILNSLKERFQNRPLAGVLLFTDGNATDQGITDFDTTGLPPIYPVISGNAKGHRDLTISHLSVTTTAFEDAPVTIQADVAQLGLPEAKVIAKLLDEKGETVKEETLVFGRDAAPLAFRFQFRPKSPGLSFYRVTVETSALAIDKESTAANNQRLVSVDRGSGPYRVLYLTGRPNWEFKFLNRAIDSDEQVKLTGVIRVARREPKFDWRSRDGEATNPLFRGFDRTGEETERYDQPVLVRLNTRDPNELRDGFPKKAEDLYQFHAVVIDDLEAGFFTADQMTLLERFVSERGGGLLMLGGAESFRHGNYDRTPVGRMLPLYLNAVEGVPSPTGYRLSLTRDGWLQPWARLRPTETEEQQRLKELPTFQTINRAGNLKPGATVIAEVTDGERQRHPALAVQRFGRGRCAALLIGDLWRWQLDRTDSQRDKDDLGKAWRQTVRWLIADVPDRIELRVVPQDDFGQPLTRLEARIRTSEFQPQDNAAVKVSLTLPDKSVVTQQAEPSLQEAGLYESTFASRMPGQYRLSVEVADAEGKSMGKSETGWAADPDAEEFQRVAPNDELMSSLAKQTGGEVIRADSLESFVRSLPTRQAPLTESYTTPLWHQPWLLVLIVSCLCGEWALRRWRGLP
ncbi:MAG: glutamine amidotransferase [Planctomycetota bacterium]